MAVGANRGWRMLGPMLWLRPDFGTRKWLDSKRVTQPGRGTQYASTDRYPDTHRDRYTRSDRYASATRRWGSYGARS